MRHITSLVALVAVLAGCGSDSGVGLDPLTGTTQVRVLRGRTSDTIFAQISPLVVEVRGVDGKPAAGVIVRFSSTWASGGGYAWPKLTLCDPSLCGATGGPYANLYTTIERETSSSGIASVGVKLGGDVEDVGLVVEVPDLAVTDTVDFTVRPGRPYAVKLLPRDSAMYVGGSVNLIANVVDRAGNARSETVALSSPSAASATLSGTTLTGHTIGRTVVIGKYGTLKPDTIGLSVVPRATVAWVSWTDGSLYSSNLDGSDYRDWNANGEQIGWLGGQDAIVMIRDNSGFPQTQLWKAISTGAVSRIPVDTTSLTAQYSPSSSRGGEWIYFSARTRSAAQTWQVHRVRPNGSAQERLSPDELKTDWRSNISHDGTKLAYLTTRGTSGIYIMNVETRATAPLGSLPNSVGQPVWSPDGTRLAYFSGFGDGLRVIDATGTNDRPIAVPNLSGGVDWTPDGEWLVTCRDGIVLVNVANGTVLSTGIATWACSEPSVRR